MGSLADLVQKKVDYIMLEPDKSVVLKYVKWSTVETQFGARFRYYFDIDGVEKHIDSSSNRVAMQFDAIPAGAWVKVYKGIDPKTDKGFYNVSQVADEEGNPLIPVAPVAPVNPKTK